MSTMSSEAESPADELNLDREELLELVKQVHWDLGYCTSEEVYRSGLATALRAKFNGEKQTTLTVKEEYKLEVFFKAGDEETPKPLIKPTFNPETREYEYKPATQRCDIVVLRNDIIVAILELKFAQKLCYSHAAQALGYAKQCVRNGKKISPRVKLFIVNFYKDGTSKDCELSSEHYEGRHIRDNIRDWCHNDAVVLIDNVFEAGIEDPLPIESAASRSKSSASKARTPRTPSSNIETPARTPKTPSSS